MADEDLMRARELASPPTVRELAMVLFRRRNVFICTPAFVLALAILYAIAGTKYEANMKVLVRRGRANAPVTAQQNAPLDLTRMVITEEELNSEVELLRDDEVLRKVVKETGIGGRDWFHFLRMNEGNAQRVERTARRLGKKLQVEPVKKTNLIAVSYAADDPQTAAKVLQTVEKVYLEKHMEVHRPLGEQHFFEQQTAESRRQLEAWKQKLTLFTEQHGAIAAAEQRDLTLQKWSEVDANYRQTRVDLTETQQRVRELESQLTKLPQRTTTQVRVADNPELMKALKSSLLDLQLKRTGLLTKFEPGHRLVREVEQQIAQAQTTIANENAIPVKDETTDKDAQYEWAKSELQKMQVQLRGLQVREVATGAQQAAYQTEARRLGEDAITQDDLLSSEKIETYYEEVGKRLAEQGHEVTVYCRSHFTSAVREYAGMRLVRLPTIRSKHLETLIHTLLSTMHALTRQYDVVHYHALGPSLFSFVPRLFGKKTAVTVQGLDWQRKKWGRFASAILRLGERAAVRFPNATMVVSPALQRRYREIHATETFYVTNGGLLRERTQPRKILEWGLQPQKYVLFLGRFSPEKGCHLLVEAFEQIDTDVVLVMAGASSYCDEYAEELKRHASERIRILDWVSGETLDELLTNAMIFVLPSDLEGLSLALLDAMGAGVCVLATDVPENRELVQGAGFTFQRGSAADLAARLRFLIANPAVRQAAAKIARKRIEEQYQWQKIVAEIEKIYFQLTAREPLPATARKTAGRALADCTGIDSERKAG